MSGRLRSMLRRVAGLLIALWAGVLLAAPASATLTFELRTGDSSTNTQSLPIDSNQCPNAGPTAMYVGGLLTNTGASDVTEISASMTGLTSDVFLAGGQAATQYIGTLGSGESISVNWFIGYSCAFEGQTVSPVVSFSSSLGTLGTSVALTVRDAISANAGGRVISSTLGPGAVVGQTIYFDAQYRFGGSAVGDEFFLQPSGSQTFNAACFRLVGSEITQSNVIGAPVGATNLQYFIQSVKQAGNNYTITVRYRFEYLCAGASTTARPYAAQTSGSDNIKYTGNFDGTDSIAINFPSASNPFTITKSVSESLAFTGSQGNLTYTVSIANPSAYDATIASIVDTLPTGMTFVGLTANSEVVAANSSALPATGDSGTISFVGRRGTSYLVPAGGTVTLEYTATRPSDAGEFVNSAQGVVGSETTPIAQATYTQVDVQPLSVTKLSAILSDPVNGTADPKAIPGALVEYTITVGNPNPLPIDPDSVSITDDPPATTRMCLVDALPGGPVTFVDGTTSSALSYTFTSLASADDDIEFSDDGRSSWTYVPTADADGCDGSISDFRISPKGELAANSSFVLKARFVIE